MGLNGAYAVMLSTSPTPATGQATPLADEGIIASAHQGTHAAGADHIRPT